MAETYLAGTRIRERRISAGMRQLDVARRIGISPSYLNLIEHNKRRIGGKRLLALAEVLGAEPSVLAQGAEAALMDNLRRAARGAGSTPELDRLEEFATRFPGWAALVARLSGKTSELEEAVASLTDRMAHDPQLATSLHEVISTVTSIRSAASILMDTTELEPEWQNRFHRNISEDSARLAEGAESLVRYLEHGPDVEAQFNAPLDELHAFLARNDHHFPALEGSAPEAVDPLIEGADELQSKAARALARRVLQQYMHDARALPLDRLTGALEDCGLDPAALSRALDTELPVLFRRLALLPQGVAGAVGLVSCDGSGAITFRKPIAGFDVPRLSGACALWPLFQALGTPAAPIEVRLRQAGRDHGHVRAFAVGDQTAASFDAPPLRQAHMLILGDTSPPGSGTVRQVGINCPICPIQGCPARREPEIMSQEF